MVCPKHEECLLFMSYQLSASVDVFQDVLMALIYFHKTQHCCVEPTCDASIHRDYFFLHSFIDTDLLYKILFLFFIAATFCILIIIIEAYIYDGLLNYCWLFGTTEIWKVDVPVLRGSVRWEHKPRASCTVRLWQFHTFHLRTACSIFCLLLSHWLFELFDLLQNCTT